MADEIGQGGTITRPAVFTAGDGTAVDPVDPRVSIIDANGTTVLSLASPTHDGLGLYHYDYAVAVDGPLGAWTARWFGVINGVQAGPIDDNFTVVPAGDIDFPDPLSSVAMTCQPWLTEDQFTVCTADDFADGTFPLIVQAANDLLFMATVRQFPGVCTDVVRPTGMSPVDGVSPIGLPASMSTGNFGGIGSWAAAFPTLEDGSTWVGWCNDGGFPLFCVDACRGHRAVRLPAYPVVDVVGVKVDGVALASGSWVIVDDRWVMRSDGHRWPCRQRLDRLDTEDDTWSITYRWGQPVPASGLLALQVLVCELGKAFAADPSCRLPKRLQSITREGMTAVVLDPFSFLDGGRFGIYEIDTFLRQVNPYGIAREGRVISPATLGSFARHVR